MKRFFAFLLSFGLLSSAVADPIYRCTTEIDQEADIANDRLEIDARTLNDVMDRPAERVFTQSMTDKSFSTLHNPLYLSQRSSLCEKPNQKVKFLPTDFKKTDLEGGFSVEITIRDKFAPQEREIHFMTIKLNLKQGNETKTFVGYDDKIQLHDQMLVGHLKASTEKNKNDLNIEVSCKVVDGGPIQPQKRFELFAQPELNNHEDLGAGRALLF